MLKTSQPAWPQDHTSAMDGSFFSGRQSLHHFFFRPSFPASFSNASFFAPRVPTPSLPPPPDCRRAHALLSSTTGSALHARRCRRLCGRPARGSPTRRRTPSSAPSSAPATRGTPGPARSTAPLPRLPVPYPDRTRPHWGVGCSRCSPEATTFQKVGPSGSQDPAMPPPPSAFRASWSSVLPPPPRHPAIVCIAATATGRSAVVDGPPPPLRRGLIPSRRLVLVRGSEPRPGVGWRAERGRWTSARCAGGTTPAGRRTPTPRGTATRRAPPGSASPPTHGATGMRGGRR